MSTGRSIKNSDRQKESDFKNNTSRDKIIHKAKWQSFFIVDNSFQVPVHNYTSGIRFMNNILSFLKQKIFTFNCIISDVIKLAFFS